MKSQKLSIITLFCLVSITFVCSQEATVANDPIISEQIISSNYQTPLLKQQLLSANQQQDSIDQIEEDSTVDEQHDQKDDVEDKDDSETKQGQHEGESEGDIDDQKEKQQGQGEEGGHHHYLHPSQGQFWINAFLAALCTLVGAFCSGMTVGLMSIQKIQLQIMSMSKDPEENKVAKMILSVVSDHHLFLVTLLVANAIGLESLPLIVHSLMPDWAAILFSTIVVLIAAEIVPQAVCTGPKKITIAYYACPIILIMIKVLYIIVYPIAKFLDYLVGKHEHQRIQHKDFANFLGDSQSLKSTEKLLLTSILELRTQRVTSIMIDLENLYMLSMEDRLTPSKVTEINKKDFSYILVFKDKNKTKIMGVIKTKQFALQYLKKTSKDKVNGQAGKIYKVSQFFTGDHGVLSVYEDTNLLQMLMLFQAKSYRFALVIGKKRKVWPGIQSIMYSKSDMIAAKEQGELLGVVFLYRIFEEIAEFNQQIATNTVRVLQQNIEMRQMKNDLNKPLIESH